MGGIVEDRRRRVNDGAVLGGLFPGDGRRSAAYRGAVATDLPAAKILFDRFHLPGVKLSLKLPGQIAGFLGSEHDPLQVASNALHFPQRPCYCTHG